MAKKSYTHRQIRKSLKHDELRDGLDRLIRYAKTNTENLLISAIIVVVLIVLVPLYFRHRTSNELRASNLLDRAMSITLQPVNEQMSMFGQGFKNVEEKYRKSQEAYAEVNSTYRGTQAARLAGMGEANSQFYLKQYDQALAAYQALLGQHPNDFWTPTLQERIGACQENLQQWQAALNTYQALLDKTPGYFAKRAVHLGMARCQFNLGKVEDARQLLQEEQQTEPGSYWSEQARLQLALLGQK